MCLSRGLLLFYESLLLRGDRPPRPAFRPPRQSARPNRRPMLPPRRSPSPFSGFPGCFCVCFSGLFSVCSVPCFSGVRFGLFLGCLIVCYCLFPGCGFRCVPVCFAAAVPGAVFSGLRVCLFRVSRFSGVFRCCFFLGFRELRVWLLK